MATAEAETESLSARQIGPGFAAEIAGIDLARPLAEADWAAIHRAYLDHQVLVFRDQALSAAQYYAFAERFGPPEPHSVVAYHHPENAAITVLSNRVEHGRPKGIRDAGSHWHSDYSYKKTTANATLLYALEVPAEGGDTLFADTAQAYEALDDATKARLDGLEARQQYRWSKDRTHPESRWMLCSEAERKATPEVVHPVVRTHPETGRKGIYVFPGITTGVKGIVGMEPAESDALLQRLYAHCQEERFIYRHRWRAGDLVIYDNHTLMHHATTDVLPADEPRTLYRINTRGSVPV